MSFIFLVVLLIGLSSTQGQNNTAGTNVTTQTTKQSSTTTITTTTTATTTQSSTTQTSTQPSTTPHPSCESKNGTSCDECLAYVDCLWCITTKKCITYPAKSILPPHSVCPLNDARWGLCTINFQILIITLSVAAALLIIGFLICIFCCCKCENVGSSRFENKMNRRADKMKTKQEESSLSLKSGCQICKR